MGISAQQARESNGQQARRHQSVDRPSSAARRHAALGVASTWRLDSAANVAVGMLLLASLPGAMPEASSRLRAARGPDDPQTPASAGSTVAPSAAAPLLGTRLSVAANGVIGACVTRPQHCAAAIGGGAALAVLAGWSAAVSPNAVTRTAAQRRDALATRVQETPPRAVGAHRLPGLQAELLTIARTCGASMACRTTAIQTLLRGLSPSQQQRLLAELPAAPLPITSSWPTGATAAALLSGADLHALAQALAALYTPDVARLQDDLERIVHATQRSGSDAVAANANRRQCIAGLLREDGHAVEERPFEAVDGRDRSRRLSGTNLIVRDPRHGQLADTATPRLLLVAHGDVAGRRHGSEGAYDNASGVAVMLHVLRGLGASPAAGDAAVDLLITDLEEHHLLGSQHFVQMCRQDDDCPTLVLNVDMAGRGGHGYVLSGSEALAGHYYRGKGPLHLQEPVIDPAETAAIGRLEATLGASAFQRHLPDAGLLLTSDHLAFQNASISAVGLSQMSADDAAHLLDRQQAHVAYERANRAVDWLAWRAHHTDGPTLSDAQVAAHRQAETVIDQAWDAYQLQRRRAAHSSVGIIHTGRDRLTRVNPRMAVDFADALLAFVNPWRRAPSSATEV